MQASANSKYLTRESAKFTRTNFLSNMVKQTDEMKGFSNPSPSSKFTEGMTTYLDKNTNLVSSNEFWTQGSEVPTVETDKLIRLTTGGRQTAVHSTTEAAVLITSQTTGEVIIDTTTRKLTLPLSTSALQGTIGRKSALRSTTSNMLNSLQSTSNVKDTTGRSSSIFPTTSGILDLLKTTKSLQLVTKVKSTPLATTSGVPYPLRTANTAKDISEKESVLAHTITGKISPTSSVPQTTVEHSTPPTATTGVLGVVQTSSPTTTRRISTLPSTTISTIGPMHTTKSMEDTTEGRSTQHSATTLSHGPLPCGETDGTVDVFHDYPCWGETCEGPYTLVAQLTGLVNPGCASASSTTITVYFCKEIRRLQVWNAVPDRLSGETIVLTVTDLNNLNFQIQADFDGDRPTATAVLACPLLGTGTEATTSYGDTGTTSHTTSYTTSSIPDKVSTQTTIITTQKNRVTTKGAAATTAPSVLAQSQPANQHKVSSSTEAPARNPSVTNLDVTSLFSVKYQASSTADDANLATRTEQSEALSTSHSIDKDKASGSSAVVYIATIPILVVSLILLLGLCAGLLFTAVGRRKKGDDEDDEEIIIYEKYTPTWQYVP